MDDPDCPFRKDIRTVDGRELATCGLVKQLTQLPSEHCEVAREACFTCLDSLTPKLATTNHVVASTLLKACIDQRESDSPHLQLLQQLAGQFISGETETPPPSTFRCDVVLFCGEASNACERAIQSILEQQDAFPILHLVGPASASALMQKYERYVDVIVHLCADVQSPFDAIQKLTPRLHTPFLAVQDANSISRVDRLKESMSAIHEHGLDIVACAVKSPDAILKPQKPSETYARFAPFEGLVIRRATFVDMGGFSDREDADAEFLFRAKVEGRRIGLLSEPLVEASITPAPAQLGPSPIYHAAIGSTLRSFGRGFEQTPVVADVVLPFFNHVDYVEEAIQSLIDQEDAEVVVHLIDDHSSEDVSQFLRRWQSHPSVRTYHNKHNIGQFASFNNVYSFLETELVAVQDGDDVSLPNRMFVSGNALRLADADLFGASTLSFGNEKIVVPGSGYVRTEVEAPPLRESNYPYPSHSSYYILNPTKVLRRIAFGELGGFADFGDRLRNRTGLDTEFQIRAHLAGLRVAISSEALVKYRVHDESATQDGISGWGTTPRTEAQIQIERRQKAFAQRDFDPRAFGALNNFTGITERL